MYTFAQRQTPMSTFNHKKNLIKEQLERCNTEEELQNLLYCLNNSSPIEPNLILGKYKVEGQNQDETQSFYSGQLDIKINSEGQIKAVWIIGKSQLQFGTGFMCNNILVFHFYYEGEADHIGKQFKGIVAYKILPDGNLDGFWSEEQGDSMFLGKEFAQKVIEVDSSFSLN